MTPKQFELIRQAGIKKWAEPEKIKIIEEADDWWYAKGMYPCSFSKSFDADKYSNNCKPCPLTRRNIPCISEWDYLDDMFSRREPRPESTIERFHKKSAIIKQKIQKSRYLKRFKDIEFKGV